MVVLDELGGTALWGQAVPGAASLLQQKKKLNKVQRTPPSYFTAQIRDNRETKVHLKWLSFTGKILNNWLGRWGSLHALVSSSHSMAAARPHPSGRAVPNFASSMATHPPTSRGLPALCSPAG